MPDNEVGLYCICPRDLSRALRAEALCGIDVRSRREAASPRSQLSLARSLSSQG